MMRGGKVGLGSHGIESNRKKPLNLVGLNNLCCNDLNADSDH